jgi:hypothetical protein
VARDAIARQSDVEMSSVKLTCNTNQGKYRPGTITFEARKGRSIDLDKLRESIAATRLSGHTNMRVDYLEITVLGKIYLRDKDMMLKVSGTSQELVLAADDRELEKRLLDLAGRGGEITLKGRVDGWNGRFPVVLKSLVDRYGTDGKKPVLLVATGIEETKK